MRYRDAEQDIQESVSMLTAITQKLNAQLIENQAAAPAAIGRLFCYGNQVAAELEWQIERQHYEAQLREARGMIRLMDAIDREAA